MTILVTGSTGFVGSQICRALVERGEKVRAFHRPTSSLLALEGLAVEHALGDLTQPETIQAAMQGVETVFHAAAHLGSFNDREYAYAVTVGGTRTVLEAALQGGVRRVVHTSSVAALGVPLETARGAAGGRPTEIDENHTWNFPPSRWPYGHSKYLAEMEVQKIVARGLDVVIVNPGVVLGPGDLNQVSGSVIVQVGRGRMPVAVQGGSNVIHVRDVVRGHLAAWQSGSPGERYILGNENLSHRDLLEMIAEVAGVRPPLFTLPARPVRALAGPLSFLTQRLSLPVSGEALHKAGYYFYYDTRKAREKLGLVDLIPARQAIAEAYAWYQEHL